MVISAYQVNNVLRVYSDQLRQGKMAQRFKDESGQAPDQVSISSEARKNAIIERIAADVLESVTRRFSGNPGAEGGEGEGGMETAVFERLQEQVGRRLGVGRDSNAGFVFKELDEDGEAARTLSREDSKLLTHKLKSIIDETVYDDLS
jgi:hypothetical protein